MLQKTEQWKAARLGCFGGTRADMILNGAKKGQEALIAEVVAEFATASAPEFRGNEHTRRGNEMEPRAIQHYQLMHDCDVHEGGFIVSTIHPLITFSPDGRIGINQGGLEIKAPMEKKHTGYLLGAAVDREYVAQCQWGLMITGAEWWDFMSYCETMPAHLRAFEQRFTLDDDERAACTLKALAFAERVEMALKKLELWI